MKKANSNKVAKQQRRTRALQRFSVRAQGIGEPVEQYAAYLGRKAVEKSALVK